MTLRSASPANGAWRAPGPPGAPDHAVSPSDTTLPATAGHAATRRESRRNSEARDKLTHRVRAEFLEMPGMQLTLRQAQRLFGLPSDICQRVLAELMREGFLYRARDGMFARREFSRG